MAGKREKKAGRRPGALAVVMAAMLVLVSTEGSRGSAVSSPVSPLEEPAALLRKEEPAEVTGPAAPLSEGPLTEEEGETEEPERTVPAGPVPVPESEPAADTYFDGAVFLGDSRTEGFYLYSGLKTGQYLYAVGATVESVFSKPVWDRGAEKVSLLDALAELDCRRVYLMLGVNELGWSKIENFHDQYALVIDRIREDHPEAEIALQSILPVSSRQEAKGTYVNNRRIEVYNQVIAALAEEKGCAFVNVAEAVTGEDGCLPANLNFDGVHLNPAGCRIWLDYLRTHTF